MRRGGQLLPAVSTQKDKGFSNTESNLLEICTPHSQEDIECALDTVPRSCLPLAAVLCGYKSGPV